MDSSLNETIIQRNCILFLGAGASAPLGLKTTAEFLQTLPKECLKVWQNNNPVFRDENSVSSTLNPFFQICAKHFGIDQPDIENVLDYIDFVLQIGNETKTFPKQIAASALHKTRPTP